MSTDNKDRGVVPRLGPMSAAIAVAFVILQGCERSSVPLESGQESGRPPVVDARVEAFPREGIYGLVGQAVIVGGTLWVRDLSGSPYFHVLDPGTGRLVRSIGRVGEAAGELTQATSLLQIPGDDSTVWVWDSALGRLTGFPTRGRWPPPTVQTRARHSLSRGFLSSLGPHALLMLTRRDTSQLVVLTHEGNVRSSGTIPSPVASTLGRRAVIAALNGAIACRKSDGSMFAVVHGGAGRIQRFDSLARLIDTLVVPNPSVPQIIDRGRGGWEIDLRRVYYRGCAFVGNELWALYSGEEMKGRRWSGDGREIHVFDGTGRLTRTIRLDTPIAAFVADSTSETIYVVSASRGLVGRVSLGMR